MNLTDKQTPKKTNRFWILVAVLSLVITGISTWYITKPNSDPVVTNQEQLQSFTTSQLAEYDGTDTSKPIYLAYQGYVYDVSAGQEYYQDGGTYNYLAGKDSTAELNLFGGEIIKAKYPIIGTLQ